MKLITKYAAATLLSFSLTAPVLAETTFTTDKLKAMMADMGYEPTVDKDNHVHLENQGKGKRVINFGVYPLDAGTALR